MHVSNLRRSAPLKTLRTTNLNSFSIKAAQFLIPQAETRNVLESFEWNEK